MTKGDRYIRQLSILDPRPITLPRGVLRNVLDNYELLALGASNNVHDALLDHLEQLVGREWRKDLQPPDNVVPFPSRKRVGSELS